MIMVCYNNSKQAFNIGVNVNLFCTIIYILSFKLHQPHYCSSHTCSEIKNTGERLRRKSATNQNLLHYLLHLSNLQHYRGRSLYLRTLEISNYGRNSEDSIPHVQIIRTEALASAKTSKWG